MQSFADHEGRGGGRGPTHCKTVAGEAERYQNPAPRPCNGLQCPPSPALAQPHVQGRVTTSVRRVGYGAMQCNPIVLCPGQYIAPPPPSRQTSRPMSRRTSDQSIPPAPIGRWGAAVVRWTTKQARRCGAGPLRELRLAMRRSDGARRRIALFTAVAAAVPPRRPITDSGIGLNAGE